MSKEQKEGKFVIVTVDPPMVNGYVGEVFLRATQRPEQVETVKAPSSSLLPQARKTPAYLG